MGDTTTTRRRDDAARALRTDPSNSPPAGTQITFRTATGSLYRIDLAAMTWARTPTEASGRLSIDGGPVTRLAIGRPGQPAILLLPPLDELSEAYQITTSAIVEYGAAADGEAGR